MALAPFPVCLSIVRHCDDAWALSVASEAGDWLPSLPRRWSGGGTIGAVSEGGPTMASAQSIPVTRLNHAVLFVRDLDGSVEFYRRAFGLEEIAREGGRMAFLRSPLSGNHHDLGLFAVGADAASPPAGAVGLYHLAWEVSTIEELAAASAVLAGVGALTGQSDHGATKSLYG